ncbi:MAG TPA: hypothetical protein VH370_21720 [Humisphaera sp.]|jgi:hypothetical protein|nr:hypothetical protein [Humisphaera sp.]
MQGFWSRWFSFAVLLSLLALVATTAFWISSYWWTAYVVARTMHRFADSPLGLDEQVQYVLGDSPGELIVLRRRGTFGFPSSELAALPRQRGQWKWSVSAYPASVAHPSRWFGHDHHRFFHQGSLDALDSFQIPYWVVAILFGLLPFTYTAQAARRRRTSNANRCGKCGYDLRATPLRCPECGTIPTKTAG